MKRLKSLDQIPAIKKYLQRIGAEPRSLRTAVVKETSGDYWTDIAAIRFSPDGEVIAPEAFAPTQEEAEAIKAEAKQWHWPQPVTIPKNAKRPKELSGKTVYEFRSPEGELVMLQERRETPEGKAYLPWTYWSDGRWRIAEPEGKLPLFGAERLKGAAAVMIHEGAKAAAYCQWLKDGAAPEARRALELHPFKELIQLCEHVGWIGGALNPERTDWGVLKRYGVKVAYIVPDNDWPGYQAVPKIARAVGIEAWTVQWTNDFPQGWDMADPWPEVHYNEAGLYIGPRWQDMLVPATWATKPHGKGYALRDVFARQWCHIIGPDMIGHVTNPRHVYGVRQFNQLVRQFSDVEDTVRLLLRHPHPTIETMTYRPDKPAGVLLEMGRMAYNAYIPPAIEPVPGDIGPFHELMEHLFPLDLDREYMYKWIATLVARPDIRLRFGTLVVSETHGVGKTFLAEGILAPLVGEHNVSMPAEHDVVDSAYTDWVADKRLIIISEIYAGHSWKAYNRLKGIMSDDWVRVNRKYQPDYTTRCWATVMASSNELQALKIARGDRRWLVPRVREEKMKPEMAKKLAEWIAAGGLRHVLDWALGYGDYHATHDIAPITAAKREMIEFSVDEGEQMAADLATAMAQEKQPMAVRLRDVREWVERVTGKGWLYGRALANIMRNHGMIVPNWRVYIGKRKQHVAINPFLANMYPEILEAESEGDVPMKVRKRIREALVRPEDVIEDEM